MNKQIVNGERQNLNKLGFTLVELLGVLIILSAVVLIVFPSILNQLKKSQGKIDNATEALLSSAAELYLGEHKNQYGIIENDVYCISLETLIADEKLTTASDSLKKLEGFHFVKVNITANRIKTYEIVESCTEINTTPGVPNEPDLEPGANSQAPVIEFTGSNYIPDTATSFDVMDGVLISDDNTPRSEIKVTITGTVSLGIVGKYPIVYEAVDSDSNVTTKVRIIEVVKISYLFDYTGSYQEFKAPIDGIYQIELWGAQGGTGYLNTQPTPGKGAYTSGTISLEKDTLLYVFVGEKGNSSSSVSSKPAGGYNGGGNGTTSTDGDDSAGAGGGATDVRYFDSTPTESDLTWNSVLGLRSRIMVAAGGGGSHSTNTTSYVDGMNAGGLAVTGMLSTWASTWTPTVNQTTGGAFGYGSNGPSARHAGAGGGGGYYGGYARAIYGTASGISDNYSGRASGGSSYISGHLGCVAVTSKNSTTPKSGCSDGTTDPTCSHHYSNYIFKNTVMKAGNESMPSHVITNSMTGNAGNGYARITLLLD